MKILYATDSFPPESVGGAGQVAFDMAKGMIANGHDAAVLSATTKRDNEGVGTYEGVSVQRIYSPERSRFFRSYFAAWNPFMRRKFIAALKTRNPDIVHFHNIHEHFSFASLRWAYKLGAPVFITLHDTLSFSYTRLYHFIDPQKPDQRGPFDYRVPLRLTLRQMGKAFNPFRNGSIRKSLRRARVIFSVSDALQDALNQNGIQNVQTLYNGVDIREFKATPEEVARFRSRWNFGDRPAIVFGGRAMQDKGPEVLLEAMPGVLAQTPRALVVIATEGGEYQNRLKSMAQKLGIESSVRFIDLLHGRERAALFSAASIVVVPSLYFDPAPLMAMQAMAAGKPVIGTCFGGTPEIVTDRVAGYIVNPYDIQELQSRMSELLADHALLQKMGSAAEARIQEHFTLNAHIRRVLAWYARALPRT